MKQLGYGSWPSPLTAADLARSALRLSPGIVDGEVAYWAEGHPEQAGRVSLWCRDRSGIVSEVTPPTASVRSRVNEYGGGDWTVADGLVAYSEARDNSVWLIEPEHPPRCIAAVGGLRYGGLHLAPSGRLLVAVREDHRADGEPLHTIVALNLDTTNPDGGRILVGGSDFYAHPCVSDDGRLAWCEWDHPNMPWDQASIMVAPLAEPATQTVAATAPGVSALYPAWSPDGALLYLSDVSGFWNFQRWQDGVAHALHDAPYDFCGPLWVLSPVPYAIIDEHRLGCTWLVDGFAQLGVLDFSGAVSTLRHLESPAVSAQVTGRGSTCLALLGYADRPNELVELAWSDGTTLPIRRSAEISLRPEMISRAQAVSWSSPEGAVHAWYYPPTHADCVAPLGELPPVQIWTHGGPTAFAGPDFTFAVQYWTTRGIGILDVNYSGSSGYGRAYRDRLAGTWGIIDVRDCVEGAQALVDTGRADPTRLSIRGSSAGGYTTLAALVSSTAFAAGISVYGIGDLEALVTSSHKFEAHYTDRLVAPYPARRQVYLDRSPLQHLERLSAAMLILQGADDPVVPPSQAQALAEAVAAKGLPVRLSIFPGEGHGFRRAETIIAVAEQAEAFLAAVHGYPLAGQSGTDTP